MLTLRRSPTAHPSNVPRIAGALYQDALPAGRRRTPHHVARLDAATMTLDLYGHLFDDRLDEVAGALDAAARATRQRPSMGSAGGQLIKLPAADAEPSN
jgi:hypothetical protein